MGYILRVRLYWKVRRAHLLVLNFRSKGVGVALQNRLDSFTASSLMLLIIHAVGAIA